MDQSLSKQLNLYPMVREHLKTETLKQKLNFPEHSAFPKEHSVFPHHKAESGSRVSVTKKTENIRSVTPQ